MQNSEIERHQRDCVKPASLWSSSELDFRVSS